MIPKIVHARPPNFDDIRKVFPMAENPNCIFSYGHTIFVPSGEELPVQLLKHEYTHCKRQGTNEDDIIEWWEKYLKDMQFRYNEELIAHIAEYRKVVEIAMNRQHKRMQLKIIAKRLSGPLYGRMVTFEQAKRELQDNG